MKDCWIQKFFSHVICKRNFSVTLLNGARFLQVMLDNSLANVQIPYEMSFSRSFETKLYFHALAFITEGGEKRI